MTYVTPHVDIQQEAGWNHLVGGRWVRPTKGPLYMDPFPLSDAQFLVAYNPDKSVFERQRVFVDGASLLQFNWQISAVLLF